MSPPESDNTTEEVVAGGSEALVAAATNNNLQSDPLPLDNAQLEVANNNINHSEVVVNGGTKDEGSLREAMEIDKSINNAAESQVNDETTAQAPAATVATAPADVEPTTTDKDIDDNGNDNDISKTSPQHESTTTIANNLTVMPAKMNISESTTTTVPDSPRRGERVIKKRRNDDFVYTKKDEVEEKKQQKAASSTITTSSSPSKKKKTPKKQSPPQQQQRKRPNHCPSIDSILIDVPLGVTADLGIALKRTRKKRIKRIQNWITSAPYNNTKVANAVATATAVGKKKKKSESSKQIKRKGNDGNDTDDDDDDSFINDDDIDDNNEHDITQDITLDDETDLGRTPTRNQFGSVLDYLEAKYVRGVMIADYDDRELAREQHQQKQQEEDARSKQKGEEDEDSEGDNSCYDDEDGFIDDSLILEDVAGQVMASSTYGLTQIEEEARRRKEERNKKESGGGVDTSIDQSTLEKLGITDDKMMDENNLAEDGGGGGGMDADFDDGFFVNLGDLEMAEGWNGDNVVISPSKKKKRVKKRASKGGAASKDDKPMKKKKKLSLSSTSSSPTKKKKKAADETKKKKTTDKTKQKSDSSSKATPSPVKNGKKKTTAPSSGKSEDKQPKKKDQTVKHPPKKMTPEKERSVQLRKVMKRKYNACVKMIKELTTDHLPRKQRNKKTVKLSVNIPEGKTIGDEITFANPNVPGQKLKVAIPAKADMEKRTFVASVPGPKVPFTKKENSLPKEFRDALTDYSNAYDDWVAAEAIHNESLPEKKRKDYKINDERMKKFDEMIPEFPTKLATPIDASYLRLAVRQVKSNRARQEKRKSGAESPKKRQVVTEKVEINMHVPQKGSEFASVSFNRQDFQE